jgi:hypothetical protein
MSFGPMSEMGLGRAKNSNAHRARRNILEKLRVTRTDDSADMRLGDVLENCIFYIFPMYVFLHSLGQNRAIPARVFPSFGGAFVRR